MSKAIDIVNKDTKKTPEPKPKNDEPISITVNRISTSKKDEEKTRSRFKGSAALKKIKNPLKSIKKIKPQKKSQKSTKADDIKDTKSAIESEQTTRKTKSRVQAKIANLNARTLQNILNILGVIATVLLAAIIIVLVIQKLQPEPISEDYFVSDETKSVIGMSTSGSTSDPSHIQTFVVYDFEGDNVVGLKTYFEYTDSEAAAAALERRKSQPEFEDAELNDKYIIVTAKPESYQGLTASDVRQQEEAIKQFQASTKKDDKKDDKK